jgi:hypothetical protein
MLVSMPLRFLDRDRASASVLIWTRTREDSAKAQVERIKGFIFAPVARRMNLGESVRVQSSQFRSRPTKRKPASDFSGRVKVGSSHEMRSELAGGEMVPEHDRPVAGLSLVDAPYQRLPMKHPTGLA